MDWEAVGEVLGCVAASGAAAAVDSGLVLPGPSTCFVGGALATAPRSGDVSALLVGDAVGPAAAEPPPREAVGSGLATALGVGLGLVALGPVLEVVVADWLGVDSRPPGPELVVAGAFPAWVTELAVGDG
jgi:hypothetical protein